MIPSNLYRWYLYEFSVRRTFEWVEAYYTLEHYRWIPGSSPGYGHWWLEYAEQVTWWYYLVGWNAQLGGA